jgi:hypothetical protein
LQHNIDGLRVEYHKEKGWIAWSDVPVAFQVKLKIAVGVDGAYGAGSASSIAHVNALLHPVASTPPGSEALHTEVQRHIDSARDDEHGDTGGADDRSGAAAAGSSDLPSAGEAAQHCDTRQRRQSADTRGAPPRPPSPPPRATSAAARQATTPQRGRSAEMRSAMPPPPPRAASAAARQAAAQERGRSADARGAMPPPPPRAASAAARQAAAQERGRSASANSRGALRAAQQSYSAAPASESPAQDQAAADDARSPRPLLLRPRGGVSNSPTANISSQSAAIDAPKAAARAAAAVAARAAPSGGSNIDVLPMLEMYVQPVTGDGNCFYRACHMNSQDSAAYAAVEDADDGRCNVEILAGTNAACSRPL